MKNPLIYLAITALLFACTDDDSGTDCALIIPSPNNFLLRIQDAQGDPLIGTVFTQDSFKLRGNNAVTYIKPTLNGNPADLFIFFTQIDDGVDYYLDLSETDTDTIRANYTVTTNECATSFDLEGFFYNGTLGENDGDNLVIATKD